MRQGRRHGWWERPKAPGAGSDGGPDVQKSQQTSERHRLVAALAHEREKVDKLKRRLELVILEFGKIET